MIGVALGVLEVVFVVLVVIAVILQISLYKSNSKKQNAVYIGNIALGIILSYLAYTSLPVNFTAQRSLTIGLGALVLLAFLLKFIIKKHEFISKWLLSIAVIGSFIQLFL